MVEPNVQKRYEANSTFHDRTIVMEYDDPEEQRAMDELQAEEEEERRREEEEEEEERRRQEEEEMADEEFSMTKASSLLSKVQDIMEREPTPVVSQRSPRSFVLGYCASFSRSSKVMSCSLWYIAFRTYHFE